MIVSFVRITDRTVLAHTINAGYFVMFQSFIIFIIVGREDFTEHSKVDDQVVPVAFKPVGDSHCFFVNITDDDIPEDTEEFNVTLNIGVNDPILLNSVILKPKVVTIRIIDNDGE